MLNDDEMIQFNKQIAAKSEWFIDRLGMYVRSVNCERRTYSTENSSSTEFWLELASKAASGAFEQKPVFKGLCYIMLQAAECEENNKGMQNLKRHRSASEDAINNPDLCYENVARFKRLLDVLNYKGPVAAMTDCTKLKAGLQYSSKLGCIVRSTLNHNDCKIKTYDDIYDKVSLPKFSPIIVALIPTRNDNAEKVFTLHQKLIDIVARLDIHIISIGSDGAAIEFQAQNLLQATKTNMCVQHRNIQYGINFNCSVFPKIGPVTQVEDCQIRNYLGYLIGA
ncbi:hypothetical protein RclHR1_08130003 [Rhizophagus clarus]|uniref:Uncharacterized protein n=1 Tax=Rhizophagus clarus TaxID=94130 RepID=A0A2Z6SEC7_9GLOM|nr:hypothetical protein RclHR1_08130003 [Rhizophagus clarus]